MDDFCTQERKKAARLLCLVNREWMTNQKVGCESLNGWVGYEPDKDHW
jgi:hypothetical protein